MASLYVTEFRNGVSPIGSALAQLLPQPAIKTQAVSIGMSSAASAAFDAKTYAVEIETDAICSFVFGPGPDDPTATAADARMAAGDVRRYAVPPGGKIAVITNS